jgi:hypothetical protein
MTGIVSLVGSGVALVTAGVCWLLLRHLNHLPSGTHPWLHRLVIIGMYCAGAVAVLTPGGQWVISRIEGAFGLVGASTAPGSGLGWALVTLAALAMAATVIVALIWSPSAQYAYVALAAPLVFALAPAGAAHNLFVDTAAPAQHVVSSISTWAGG